MKRFLMIILSAVLFVMFSYIAIGANTLIGNQYITIPSNLTVNGTLLYVEGGTGKVTMGGNLNVTGNITMDYGEVTTKLTVIGSMIINGLTTSGDIIPETTELYSIGNSTHWFDKGYFKNLYAQDGNFTNLNSSEITSNNIDVDKNLTIGDYKVYQEGGNMVVRI